MDFSEAERFIILSALKVLIAHFEYDPQARHRVLNTKVGELKLSLRAANCLWGTDIVYIGDLIQKTEREMLRMPNFGRKSLNEIKKVLAEVGLHFGMEAPTWSRPC